MGRGLSKLQKDILGVAYHANRLTQDGKPSVKTGEYRNPERYSRPVAFHGKCSDLHHALASVVLFNLALTEYDQRANGMPAGAIYTNTAKAKSAKASVVRAMTRLNDRGLLQCGESSDGKYRWGHLLTPEGFDIGAANEVEFPDWLIWKCGLFTFGRNSRDSHFFDVCDWLQSGQITFQRLAELWAISGKDTYCWRLAKDSYNTTEGVYTQISIEATTQSANRSKTA